MRIATVVILAGTLAAAGAVVASFQSIKDLAARSIALFQEAGKVIQSPRRLTVLDAP